MSNMDSTHNNTMSNILIKTSSYPQKIMITNKNNNKTYYSNSITVQLWKIVFNYLSLYNLFEVSK